MSFSERGGLKCCIICADKEKPGKTRRSKGGVRMSDTIQMVLDKVQVFLAQWLDSHLKGIYQKDFWQMAVLGVLTAEQIENVEESGARSLDGLDFATLIAVFLGNFKVLRKSTHLDPELADMAKHAKKIRNLFAHRDARTIKNPNAKKTGYQIESLQHFLEGLGADDALVREIWGLHDSVTQKAQAATPVQSDQGWRAPAVTTRLPSGIKISVSAPPRQQGMPTTSGKPNMTMTKPSKTKIATAGGQDATAVEVPHVNDTMPGDAKRYLAKIIDRLRALGIVGFDVQVKEAADAMRLLQAVSTKNAENSDSDTVQSAIVIERTANARRAIADVQGILDRGFRQTLPKSNLLDDTHLVWFFGERKSVTSKSDPKERFIAPPTGVEAAIPAWFERVICGIDLPYLSVEEVQVTSRIDSQGVERYAKTYSPRTFAEGVVIGKGLPIDFMEQIASKGFLKIIDVGCGTGAMSQGILHGLDRKLKKPCVANLTLVDGNTEMLKKAQEFLVSRENERTYSIPSIKCELIEKELSLPSICFPGSDYDIIVTSKFLGELVCRGAKDVYLDFFRGATERLRKGGVLVLAEILKHKEEVTFAAQTLFGDAAQVSDLTVHPRFIGSDSSDSETVISVVMRK